MNTRGSDLRRAAINDFLISCLSLILFSSPLFSAPFDAEIEKYRAVVQANPKDLDSMVLLARYLSWSEKYEEAIQYFKKVLEIQPDHAEAKMGLATVYSWQKKYKESIKLYKEVLNRYPDSIDAMTGLARVYSWDGDTKSAVQMFQKALQFSPENRDALLGLGRVYSWNKEYKKSEEAYKKALSKNPRDIELLRGLANTYKWSEQHTKGIHTELKILEIEPANVDSMLSIGYMYGELGAMAQSIHWYEKASKIAPDRGDIQAHLGLLYTRNAQIDSATIAFKKAISLQELDIQSYISLGRVYSWQNKMEEAEKLYKRAIEINPQSAGAYAGLAQLYFFNGFWDKSIANYEKSLKIDPFYVEALQGLKRVKLLKAPAFISRYHLFYNIYRDTLTDIRVREENIHTSSNELFIPYEPGKAIEARFQFSQNALNNTDKDPNVDLAKQDREYMYDQYVGSFRLDHPLIRKKLYFSGRFDMERFERHSRRGKHRFNFPHAEWLPTGFSLLRFETPRFFSIGSFSRESVVSQSATATHSRDLYVDPLETYGIASGYDFTSHFRVIANLFFQDFQKKRGFRDRRDIRGIAFLRLPFFEPIELRYELRHISRPSASTNVGAIRFSERYFKENYLIDLLYEFHSENHSENFGGTYKNVFRLIQSFPLAQWMTFNIDGFAQINTGQDRDRFFALRSYLTFILDKDAMRGRYYKD